MRFFKILLAPIIFPLFLIGVITGKIIKTLLYPFADKKEREDLEEIFG